MSDETKVTQEYGAEQIQVLEGLEAVRKRPGDLIAAAAEFAAITRDDPELQPPAQEELPEPEMDLDAELQSLNQLLRASEKPVTRERKKNPNVEPVVIKKPKKRKSAVGVLFTIFLLCLLLAGGVWGYMYYSSEDADR